MIAASDAAIAAGMGAPILTLGMTWILAFLALAVLDFCWALYTAQVQSGNAYRAGAWAVALYAISAGATIGYTSNHWLVIPACAGAFVGTAVGVLWNKRKGQTHV
jgi:hypothetical protein